MLRFSTYAFAFAPLLLAGFVACSSSDDSPAEDGVDAGSDVATADGGNEDTGTGGFDASAGGCKTQLDALLQPVDKVSEGEVTVLSTEGTTRTLFVDAVAGGLGGAATNPRVYVNLETGSRVDITDLQRETSTDWDLAIKRPILFTNGGDGGPGMGGAVAITDKAFDAVTAADASAATFKTEEFVDDDCKAQVDETKAPLTSFSGWYNYDETTHIPSPKPWVWLVKGGTGKLYKVEILSYSGRPDGGLDGESTARFVLKVGTL